MSDLSRTPRALSQWGGHFLITEGDPSTYFIRSLPREQAEANLLLHADALLRTRHIQVWGSRSSSARLQSLRKSLLKRSQMPCLTPFRPRTCSLAEALLAPRLASANLRLEVGHSEFGGRTKHIYKCIACLGAWMPRYLEACLYARLDPCVHASMHPCVYAPVNLRMFIHTCMHASVMRPSTILYNHTIVQVRTSILN